MVSRCLSATGIRFSAILFPPGGWALLAVGLPANDRTPTGLPRSARTSRDQGGRPLDPGDHGAHPDRGDYRPGACRFTAASPCTRHTSHRQGLRLTRHQRGFKQFARPVFPSPVAARMERAALGLEPQASHPADQEPTTHARVGTGHRTRTWNYTLNSHQSISNPVVHSMRATSRRTSPKRSPAALAEGWKRSSRRARIPRALRVTSTRGPETRGTRNAGFGLVVSLDSCVDRVVFVPGSGCGSRVA